uniref:ARAD1C25850p n=1 Tax=Blastobotrys adeninivorans TaxID=409370 RepID=A0A060T7Z9_BLAAD
MSEKLSSLVPLVREPASDESPSVPRTQSRPLDAQTKQFLFSQAYSGNRVDLCSQLSPEKEPLAPLTQMSKRKFVPVHEEAKGKYSPSPKKHRLEYKVRGGLAERVQLLAAKEEDLEALTMLNVDSRPSERVNCTNRVNRFCHLVTLRDGRDVLLLDSTGTKLKSLKPGSLIILGSELTTIPPYPVYMRWAIGTGTTSDTSTGNTNMIQHANFSTLANAGNRNSSES